MPRFLFLAFLLTFFLGFPASLSAQESPYIVAYDHYLEEPGNLEIALEAGNRNFDRPSKKIRGQCARDFGERNVNGGWHNFELA